MAKSRVWKPTDEERIDWDHPYIKLTKTAPGYLVQELFGYADTSWEKWLTENHLMLERHNRRPWIDLTMLGRAVGDDD